MNLVLSFAEAAARHAEKPALYWGDQSISYLLLHRQAVSLSRHLREDFGVRPGDRVGIWLRNRPEFVVALLGVLGAGGVAVPVNNFLKAAEVKFLVEDAAIQLVITEQGAEAVAELRAALPALRWLWVEELPAPEDRGLDLEPGAAQQETDLAVLIYTSGTTGRPKGAMLSHGNLLANVASCRKVLETVDLDSFVVILPMFHSFMVCVGILLPLTSGCSVLVIRSVHPLKNALMEIIQRQATILPAIPQLFRSLAAAPALPPLPLRLCISGAAPLPVEVLRHFQHRFSFPLLEGYGLSETSPVVSLNPIHGPVKPGSIGVPIPGVEVTIQDDEWRTLPDGQVGELCVRGDNVMSGYWNQPEETAKVLRQGWLRTGDMGYRDQDGYFYITDRKKDMLLVNGINVYPREIEEVLYEFPGVKDAAVIGEPDSRRGEQPVAFLVPDDGAALETKEILRFLRSRLADYKVPRHVFVLATMPRNATGKIVKSALRKLVAET